MGKKIDLTGQRFGRLVVLRENGRAKDGQVLWLCKCSCPRGTEVTVCGANLRNENTQSCGCLFRERTSERFTKHGMRKTRIYTIWNGMLTRAGIYKGATEEFKRYYTDRGITVCDEWLVFENFRDWSLSNGYRDDLEIDRIDTYKGYYPENCRWISHRDNCNNRRSTLRLDAGRSLALFCSEIGIQTMCENGKPSKQYNRICCMYSRSHKIHPELIAKANEYLTLLKRLRASLDLLKDVREFRERCKGLQMISLPET